MDGDEGRETLTLPSLLVALALTRYLHSLPAASSPGTAHSFMTRTALAYLHGEGWGEIEGEGKGESKDDTR